MKTPKIKKPKLDPATMPGLIAATVLGDAICTLLIDGLRHLIG